MKKQRNKGKVRRKSAKMAISSIFPAFSAGKKFLSKIGLAHVMSIANTHLWAKKSEKTNEGISRKCQKTGFFGIFPVFSAGKKFLSKIGLGHVMNIANKHLCAKNWKKLMRKSREMAKKPVFPAYFWHFRPEKYVFRKSGSVTFQTLAFCISVPNFMKKYKIHFEKFKKYHISDENRLFRRFLESSGYKNQFDWQITMLNGGHCY